MHKLLGKLPLCVHMFLEQWQAGNPWLQQQCHPPYPFHHSHAASICQKSPLGRFHPVLSHSVTNPAWQNKSHMYVKLWWITWNHLMQMYLLPSLTLYNCNPLFLSLTMNMQFCVHWVQDDREANVDFHGDMWTNLPIKKNGFSPWPYLLMSTPRMKTNRTFWYPALDAGSTFALTDGAELQDGGNQISLETLNWHANFQLLAKEEACFLHW